MTIFNLYDRARQPPNIKPHQPVLVHIAQNIYFSKDTDVSVIMKWSF